MASIFTRIIKGEIPCYNIAETENCFAFLDINPLRMGHVLCVPKKEVDYLFDLEDDLLKDLMSFSKTIAIALKKAVPCKRIGVTVIGLEVPHAHIHLIPMDYMSDMNFSNPKLNPKPEEMENMAKQIINYL
ncbi:MAG TPA: HIT family protein [Bacteroidia bacterium]|nr:HIT family protein [Bacteroidia bacterium]HNT79404.1 HIT family protein [Bacteroidia bacterium]